MVLAPDRRTWTGHSFDQKIGRRTVQNKLDWRCHIIRARIRFRNNAKRVGLDTDVIGPIELARQSDGSLVAVAAVSGQRAGVGELANNNVVAVAENGIARQDNSILPGRDVGRDVRQIADSPAYGDRPARPDRPQAR